ncbi:MAG: helix-turn-helix transcriptional regulator [Hyphomicrobiaceae bacterium]
MPADQVGDGPRPRNSRRANPIDTHVGKRMRSRRMILSLSQEDLASALGITFQQIQKYERGINRIGASRLFYLARALGVDVGYFYEGAPLDELDASRPPAGFGEPENDFVSDALNTREGIELNRAFHQIGDPNVRRAVIELIRALVAASGHPVLSDGKDASETS